MTKAGLLAAALAAAAVLSGCISRGIKEGIGAVRGGKGVYAPVQPAHATDGVKLLTGYTRFELGQIKDNFGGKAPRRLGELLPAKFEAALAKKGIPNTPGGKTVVIRGEILHYEQEGMVGLAFGDFEEVLTRLDMVDKSSGKVLAIANCIGRSTESVNRGVDSKADGLAKAIADWIAENYPKPKE
ncbi:MAG TPA: hypothetical protein VNA25_00795 [Phycisphaerae bacterium]|nr:hypothetical protein [Phycisphaerae bacterium]HUT56392.1 hypothetical protein [Phycisphaerae bacterium]